LRKKGVKVCVLEARPRVGGRTLDHAIGCGNVVEGGGQWVGPGHTRVLALARELGITTFPSA
jgi:monoamine oxidase